jgi:uncharacterized membrane protein
LCFVQSGGCLQPGRFLTKEVVGVFVRFHCAASVKPYYKKFYSIVPSVLLCYFIPAIFNTFNIISGETSSLYTIASRYLLPASLVLLTLSINFCFKRLEAKQSLCFSRTVEL